ncbi:MAG: CoB--CoM heterodisulfide reductase iron-sulfur subunit A family protein [Promethearchaeota archaeon]
MIKNKKNRIGVYICWCGGNISDIVNVKKVVEAVRNNQGVCVAKDFMFVCSDAGQQMIVDDVKNHELDGVVVASCSPKLHEITFMNAVTRAGLNPYEFYHVNIRENVSWAHSDDPQGATAKAIRAVRAGIEYVKQTEPLSKIEVTTAKKVLIIGGGIAGIRAAIDLAGMGVDVVLVEKENLGGHVAHIYKTYPNGERGKEVVKKLVKQLKEFIGKIQVFTNSKVLEVSGFIGNFNIKIKPQNLEPFETTVGTIIVATGFKSYEPKEGEFGYGEYENVVTLPKFLNLIQEQDNSKVLIYNGNEIHTIGIIYCVGSRQTNPGDGTVVNEYCSRYCCNAIVYASLEIQKRYKDIHTYHFYRDIRTYGKNETYFSEVRQNGAIFLKYDPVNPLEITSSNGVMIVTIKDILTAGEIITVPVDLLVLVTGMEASENKKLEEMIKIMPGLDRFYKESHPKLKPVDSGRLGIFLAGTCQAPRDISETLLAASATAAKAASIVLKGELMLEPAVAIVDPRICTLSKKCIAECPIDAIEILEYERNGKKAWVNEALCLGCGICTAVCPTEAIQIKTLKTTQIKEMIKGMSLQ